MAGNFSDLSPEERAKLGSRGGKTAHASGSAHQWTSEEARAAGKKSGRARKKKVGQEPTARKKQKDKE